jgi:hypothetical protein
MRIWKKERAKRRFFFVKGILEFDLDDRFESNRFLRCLKATDAYLVLFDMQNLFKKIEAERQEKKEEGTYVAHEYIKVKEIYQEFLEALEERAINLEAELD